MQKFENEAARRTFFRAWVGERTGHLTQGAPFAPPEGRPPDPLDAIIVGVVEALPAALRLYPDLYGWLVADALRALAGGELRPPEVCLGAPADLDPAPAESENA